MFEGYSTIALGHQQITLSTGTVSSLSIPSGRTTLYPSGRTTLVGCMINVETQNARYRDDGVAPTSLVGFNIKTTDPPLQVVGLARLKAMQFLAASSGAILNVAYYGLSPN